MDARDAWKALHLLYFRGEIGISLSDLAATKLSCTPDALAALGPELAESIQVGEEIGYRLTEAGRQVIESCLVANHKQGSTLVRVDYPQAFVVMTFRKPFGSIYEQLIQPACSQAGIECVRGDTVLRVDELTANVFGAILRAGLVIADLSDPNPNVYYEVGLAHALGKDTFVLKQRNVELPADFQGTHYYEYDPADLATEQARLAGHLGDWVDRRGARKVKELIDG